MQGQVFGFAFQVENVIMQITFTYFLMWLARDDMNYIILYIDNVSNLKDFQFWMNLQVAETGEWYGIKNERLQIIYFSM